MIGSSAACDVSSARNEAGGCRCRMQDVHPVPLACILLIATAADVVAT